MKKIQVNHSPASSAKEFAITFLFLWVIFTLIVINTKYNILLSSGFFLLLSELPFILITKKQLLNTIQKKFNGNGYGLNIQLILKI